MAIDKITPMAHDRQVDNEFLYVAGGVALGIFAAGVVLSSPTIRRVFGKTDLESIVSTVLPDIEKYFRLRSM